ncbi:MAG TPA: rhamnan synthesis F family protein [Mesorhizobium sp.]|jgi:glycosyltransferase involved in cell wall biosynthesis|nr:rhamnan synthesis F family protein [Mesorhizobium sp.]
MIVREFDEVVSIGTRWPKVSVVIPLYNYAKMLGETLEAVKEQDLGELGLVIVDDKSTDNSLDVAKQWALKNATRFAALRVVSNRTNGGLSITRNTGTTITQSDYIFFLDADNLIYSSCIGKLTEALDQSDAAFAYSPHEKFGVETGVIGTRVFSPELLAQFPYIDAMALIRREALIRCDGYFELRHGWEDYDLWLKFAERSEYGIQVPELLGRYRVHRSSMTSTNTSINLNIAIRAIKERHPWTRVPPAVAPGSPRVLSNWNRLTFYGRIATRLMLTRIKSPSDAKRYARRAGGALRRGGLRGVAAMLRDENSIHGIPEAQSTPLLLLPSRTPAPEFDVAVQVPAGLALKTEDAPRLAAVVHLFYPEMAKEFRGYLQNVNLPMDIFITTCSEDDKPVLEKVFSDWERGEVRVAVTPNRGRDIAPKLLAFREAYENYDYVLHLHSKASPHEADLLANWRHHILQHLVGSPDIVQSTIAMFEADSGLGMIGPQHFEPIRPWINWGGNKEAALHLIEKIGISADPTAVLDFPSGSMFWLRPGALRPLLEADFSFEDFPEEAGQTDGTLAHAIERMYYLICEAAGYNWIKVAAPHLFNGLVNTVQINTAGELRRFASLPVRGRADELKSDNSHSSSLGLERTGAHFSNQSS